MLYEYCPEYAAEDAGEGDVFEILDFYFILLFFFSESSCGD